LGGVTPGTAAYFDIIELEEAYKLGGVTPVKHVYHPSLRWKRLTNWGE